MRFVVVAAACALAIFGGCTSPSPPVPPPVVPVKPAPRLVDSPLELSEAALWVGRWRDPKKWLSEVQEWLPAGAVVERYLREELAQPSFPVNPMEAVEWLVELDWQSDPPQPKWAISLALAVPPGEELQPGRVPSRVGLHCRQTTALGAARARVVCSSSEEAVDTLLPQMTRALPLVELGSSELSSRWFGSSFRSAPKSARWLQSTFAAMLGIEIRNDKIDSRLAAASLGVVRQLGSALSELNGARVELVPRHQERAVELVLQLPNRLPTSALSQALVGQRVVGLAPEQFWQFNVEAQQAGFHWSPELHLLSEVRFPLAHLLEAILEFRGVPKRLQLQARELFEQLPLPPGPFAWASGASPHLGSTLPWTEAKGWSIHTFGAGFPSVRRSVKQWLRALDDSIVGPQLRRLLGASLGKSRTPTSAEYRSLNRRFNLPAESFEVELGFPLNSLKRGQGQRLHLVFVPSPDDGFAVGWGADLTRLAGLLESGRASRYSGTLSGRAGLGRLHQVRALAGGFSSLSALSSEPSLRFLGQLFELPFEVQAFDKAPHRGQTPILMHWLAPPSRKGLEYRALLSQASITDLLVSLTMRRANASNSLQNEPKLE